VFVTNAWYVAAWSSEIGRQPLGRTLLNEPIVLFRDAAGRAAALEDRCCHRGMPLARGEPAPGGLRCSYHGLVFDGAGRCVEIPTQKTIPPTLQVRSFPVEERDALVWIWMGDPARADPSEIVAYPWHASWPHKDKTERLACNYLLISDNLLDQTHAAFVHKSTLASNPDAYASAEMVTQPTDNGVKFTRWMLNCVPPDIYARAVTFEGRVDRWQEFEYVAPSCILQFTGALDVGRGAYERGKRDGGFGLRIFYGITPETEHSSWFLWSAANGYRQNEPAATDALFREMEAAFKEDEDVLDLQQARLQQFPDRKLVNIASDGARLIARRAVARRLEREHGPEAARAIIAG
jgi:vanillate O-demethylase monooxygenase subunit